MRYPTRRCGLTLTRGPAARGVLPAEVGQPTVLITVGKLPRAAAAGAGHCGALYAAE
ncbi:MAG: hypothetical protein WDN04_00025 [Rhodospirillales bacterium]